MKLSQTAVVNHIVYLLAPSRLESLIPFRFLCKRLLVYGKTEETLTRINLESGLVSLNEARRGQVDITYKLPMNRKIYYRELLVKVSFSHISRHTR